MKLYCSILRLVTDHLLRHLRIYFIQAPFIPEKNDHNDQQDDQYHRYVQLMVFGEPEIVSFLRLHI